MATYAGIQAYRDEVVYLEVIAGGLAFGIAFFCIQLFIQRRKEKRSNDTDQSV